MKILYIYRHPAMGFSIGRVFYPIEQEMKKHCEVDSVYLPVPNYSIKGLWKNICCARKVVKAKHYDIVHITGAEHYLLPFLRSQKTVVTVHDIGFFTNRRKGLRTICKYFGWVKTLKYASKVVFISEKSQAEVKRYVRLSENQSCVIYNPVSLDFKSTAKEFNEKYPTILHIGTKPNKNLNNVILALKDIPCKLRIIGRLSEEQKTLLAVYGIDYSNDYNLTDKQIVTEYNRCDVVSFPSFYEGFGMPIIEGQATERIVVTSSISPMKEIAGNGAMLVNPKSIESIREGYLKIIENKDLRLSLIQKGKINVNKYSVNAIVSKYIGVYESIDANKC